MSAYQVKFRVIDCNCKDVYGGIYVDGDEKSDSYVICGYCGYVFNLNQVEIIEQYKNWIDLSAEIIGG